MSVIILAVRFSFQAQGWSTVSWVLRYSGMVFLGFDLDLSLLSFTSVNYLHFYCASPPISLSFYMLTHHSYLVKKQMQ